MSETPAPQPWSLPNNVYEVNLRQYTQEGSFRAFARHLPRLRDMGVEVLWFMPITPISEQKRLGSLGSYYACADYVSTNPEYGTVEDFRQLVRQAHALGFRVLIDWVANHTGWDHVWTRTHPEFYKKNDQGQFYDAHGWQDVIDLDYQQESLHHAMIQAMRYWVEQCDIDGFRCDMAMLVPLDFWKKARKELDQQKPLFWLAECEEEAYYQVFDAGYAWRLLHRMEALWRGEAPLAAVREDLRYYQERILPFGAQALFTSNHDENSHSGSEYERMGEGARAFAVLCCTFEGFPLIYSGQEIPYTGRLKFFDKDELDWSGSCTLHDFYRSLLFLRRRNEALSGRNPGNETLWLTTSEPEQVLAFGRRSAGGHRVLVLLNLSPSACNFQVEIGAWAGRYRDCFSQNEWALSQVWTTQLGPWQYRVLELQ